MGRLSTHVLDTALGKPAAGISIDLFRIKDSGRTLVHSTLTNADGRTDGPLLTAETIAPGIYELVFHAGDYLRACDPNRKGTLFLDEIPIRFGIEDAAQHYHVPLLLSPFGYSTYRGS